MKKTFFIAIICLLCCIGTEAQTSKKESFSMEIGTDGHFKRQGDQQFFVVNFPGHKASELYANVLAHMAQCYAYPDKVADKVQDRSIVVNGYEDRLMGIRGKSGHVDIKYRVEIRFKDGKIRINMPEIKEYIIITPTGTLKFEGPELSHVIAYGVSEALTKPVSYFKVLYRALVYGLQDDDW